MGNWDLELLMSKQKKKSTIKEEDYLRHVFIFVIKVDMMRNTTLHMIMKQINIIQIYA